jgi:hypothetical protein
VQEGEPLRAVAEVGDDGVEVEAALPLQPVLQGGAWHTGLGSEAALGRVQPAWVVEVGEGLGGVGTGPAERLWTGCGLGGRLR